MRRPRTRRRGVAAVEFAVFVPVLFLLVIGTIEATSMIFLKQSLKIAAYEGDRVSLVPGSTQLNVIAASEQVLGARSVQAANVTVTPADIEVQPYGTFIQVKVDAPCDQNSLFAPWFYAGRTLASQVEMMKETD